MNQRIQGVSDRFEVRMADYGLFCECGHADCVERLTVPANVFEQIRADDELFLVSPGHELGAGLELVGANGVYHVVAAATAA